MASIEVMISTRAELITAIEGGLTPRYAFFWGHTPREAAVVDRACFSQWYPRAFEVAGVRYPSAEHWMMAQKARCFDDAEALARILESPSPADAKALGRTVRNFDDAVWASKRFETVVTGNVAKFSEHPELKAVLIATGEDVLVEAAPRDLVWGIGLGAANPRAVDPRAWRGLNLLGFALMQVRARLA